MEHDKPNSLGKNERLKSRKQIDVLFNSGKKITLYPFRLLYRVEAGHGKIKAGFAVSSKNFPRAVDRNRIKRLCRETYRVQNKELKTRFSVNRKTVYLFFIYTGREMLPHEEFFRSVKQILDKLLRIIDEDNIANT